MSQEVLEECLRVAIEAAKKGGGVLRRYWGQLKDVRVKSCKGDLVTEADRESEAVIIGYLRQHFPDHSIIGEETGMSEVSGASHLWAVDPLDGTTNYTHQYPMVCISIGLIVENEPVMGVIYNPILDEMFEGGKGLGIRMNGEAIRVSDVESLDQGLLVTGFAYDKRHTEDNNFKEFCHLVTCAQGMRRAGAAALDLANCAMGRVDAYWERGLQIWDIAAGIALLREAGGAVTDYDGGGVNLDSGRILASNGKIHPELGRELMSVRG